MGKTPPELQTPRLTLRAFKARDAQPLHAILSGEGVLRYFPPAPPPDLARAERMIRAINRHWDHYGYGLWAVERRSDTALLGRCGLQWLEETGEVEVDFILGRPFWGQGYATEAGLRAVRYGFEALGRDHLAGIVHVENAASQRVLEKLGMRRVEQAEFFGIPCYRLRVDSPKN